MPLAPRAIAAQLHARFRLLGPQGLTGMAMAGIDMAAWDALAVAHDVPLCVLLGAEPRALPAYDSLGMMSAQDGVAEGLRSAAAGFTAVKFKLGWPDADTDVRFVDAVRTALGPACDIMMDYNQCLDRGEAIRRGKLLERFGLRWIEEPCRADDDASHAMVARALDTPVQIGENWWGPERRGALARGRRVRRSDARRDEDRRRHRLARRRRARRADRAARVEPPLPGVQRAPARRDAGGALSGMAGSRVTGARRLRSRRRTARWRPPTGPARGCAGTKTRCGGSR